MFLLYLSLLILAALILLAFVTQVVMPMIFGTPLFPFFRKTAMSAKVAEAASELEEVAEQQQLNELEKEINRRKAQLKKDEE